MGDLERRIVVLLVALVGVLAVGTLGYMLIEGWSGLDALYMTVTPSRALSPAPSAVPTLATLPLPRRPATSDTLSC